MEKSKEKCKEKTPAIDSFPSDETPTPTKILRMADMDLFQDCHDFKENPFDAHFRKAAEAVKHGADSLSASLSSSDLAISESDSLNTPQIFVSDSGLVSPSILSSSSTTRSRPVILRSHSINRVSSKPTASVQPSKTLKTIAPHPPLFTGGSSADNAMLLLKFPGGETVKLSNLPFIKCDSSPPNQSSSSPVSQETKLRLKSVNKLTKSRSEESTLTRSVANKTSPSTPATDDRNNLDDSRDDLKERNRMSAQRSRLKKRQYLETLTDASNKRKKENDTLKQQNKRLMDENMKLRRILTQHLDCSVTVRTGARDAIAAELSIDNLHPNVRTHNMETQTTSSTAPLPYHSPPQTHPQDLRVDTRIKDSEAGNTDQSSILTTFTIQNQTAPAALNSQTKKVRKVTSRASSSRAAASPSSSTVTKVGAPSRRLKDKLYILKQKLAEDETTLSNIKSGKI